MTQMRRILILLAFILILSVLCGALYIQFFTHDEPCPLCLLQRVGLLCVCLGLLLNFLYRETPSHWGLILLSALTGISVSIRQIVLHINSPVGFSNPIFGLHLYSWCFIIFSMVLLGASIMLITMKSFR